MIVLRTAADLAWYARSAGRTRGVGGVLVPTMGALHHGHASLIRLAARLAHQRSPAGPCVVSIFVNPTQFDDPADFRRYPRTEDADLALCQACHADVVFVPDLETVYPLPPALPPPVPPLPAVATTPGLEDACRPGHFAGVAQVVLRLFELLEPHAAVFGEKDFQQLLLVRALVADLRLDIEIIPAPTVREPDGLAASSRNRFLSPDDRHRALAIPQALCQAAGQTDPSSAEAVMRHVLAQSGIAPDYAVVRDACTLGPITPATRAMRALIAARVGPVRLIDNAPWPAACTSPA